MRFLVVCGLSETMASLVPTSRFSSVDFPAFGRPMSETKPVFITTRRLQHLRRGEHKARRSDRSGLDLRVVGVLRGVTLPADPHLVDPPPLGVQHLDGEAVD